MEINPRDAMSRDAVILGMTLWNAPKREIAGLLVQVWKTVHSIR